MLLYQLRKGTNPRRVIIYLAEKGIDVPRYEVDYANGEHRSDHYLRINPAGRAPTLVTDTGLAITDSAAITEYLEELHPGRPMIGAEPLARARVRSLERLGADLIGRCQLWLWNQTSAFPAKEASPSKETADRTYRYASEVLDALETELGENTCLAGDAPTMPTSRSSRCSKRHAKGSIFLSAAIISISMPGTSASGAVRARIIEDGMIWKVGSSRLGLRRNRLDHLPMLHNLAVLRP